MAIENPPEQDSELAPATAAAQDAPVFDQTSMRRCLTTIMSVAAVLALIFLTPALGVLLNVLSYRPGVSVLILATVFCCSMCVYTHLDDNKSNPQAQSKWAGLYRHQSLIGWSLIASILLLATTLFSALFFDERGDAIDILLSPPPAVAKVMDTANPADLEAFAGSRGRTLDAYRIFGVSDAEEGLGTPWQSFAYALASPASTSSYWTCKETVGQYLASPRRARLKLSVNGRPVDEKRMDPCVFSSNTLQLKLLR